MSGPSAYEVTQRWFRAPDGTRLAWYEGGRADGPPLVFLSGLGGGFGIWQPFLRRFAPHCRLIGWDYRGLYASEASSTPGAHRMSDHRDDLLALLRHTGVEAPVLVGWSMGVQLALELHREHGEIPRALIAVHGTSGLPLHTAFDSRWSALAMPPTLRALGRVGRGFAGIGPRLVDAPGVAPGFVWLCRNLGLMTPTMDLEAFRDVAREWTRLDFRAYAETFLHLGEHDAADLLPEIETPTLLVAGERDPLTPVHLARRMADFLPDAELVVVPEATHFGLLEQPEAILAHAARFLRERIGVDV